WGPGYDHDGCAVVGGASVGGQSIWGLSGWRGCLDRCLAPAAAQPARDGLGQSTVYASPTSALTAGASAGGAAGGDRETWKAPANNSSSAAAGGYVIGRRIPAPARFFGGGSGSPVVGAHRTDRSHRPGTDLAARPWTSA